MSASRADAPWICFDVTMLRFAADLRGIPQVVFMLLEVLSEPPFKGKVRFLAYPDVAEKHLLPRGIAETDIACVPAVPLAGRRERFHVLFSTWRYRRAARGAALLLHPEPRTVTRLPIPQVVLWHDCIQVDPKWKPARVPTRYWITLYKYTLAARRAAGITNSEHTKREVLRCFPSIDPARLTPLWLGVRESLAPSREPRAVPLALPLRCVYVGALETRKNVFALLERLQEVVGDLPFTLDLAGKHTEAEGERVRAILAASPLGAHVRLRGLVSEEELRELLASSEVSFFPSLGEGFGLPVAEAMAQGHAVFAFRNTSIPEVGGDAIVLAEDDDFAAWGRELKVLASDPEAAVALRARALERARIFTRAAMKARYRDYLLRAAGRNPA